MADPYHLQCHDCGLEQLVFNGLEEAKRKVRLHRIQQGHDVELEEYDA